MDNFVKPDQSFNFKQRGSASLPRKQEFNRALQISGFATNNMLFDGQTTNKETDQSSMEVLLIQRGEPQGD